MCARDNFVISIDSVECGIGFYTEGISFQQIEVQYVVVIVKIARYAWKLRQPTAGGFKLEILQEIDNPEGDYKVQLVLGCAAPQHDHPKPPVRHLASELAMEIVDQFYEAS